MHRWETPHTVEAVSDGHMFFWDGRRTWITELPPLTSTAVWPDKGFAAAGSVQDAAGDRVLVRVGSAMAVTRANLRPLDVGRLAGWRPGTDMDSVTPQVPDVAGGDLAPDGRHWFGEEPDQFTVYDSATGQGRTFNRPGGYPSATPYQWLNHDTIAAVALYPPVDGWLLQPVDLLVCHVSASTCSVAIKNAGTAGNLVLGDGEPNLPTPG